MSALNLLPSASGFTRAFACRPSQVLPHVQDISTNPYQSRGNVLHGFLAEAEDIGYDAALDRVQPEFRAQVAVVDFSMLPPAQRGTYAYEVAFAFDLETRQARELCRGKPRDEAYKLRRPSEIVGTADVIGLSEESVIIYDYKTGHRRFSNIEQDWQLRTYSLMAARTYGRSAADIGIIRIFENGETFFIRAELNEDDLKKTEDAIVDLNDDLNVLKMLHEAGEELPVTTGDHCTYCPALRNCSAHTTFLAKALSLPPITADNAHLYVQAVSQGGKLLKFIKKDLDKFAAQMPDGIRMSANKAYGRYARVKKDHINIEKAKPILEHELGARAYFHAVKEFISKKTLEEALHVLKEDAPSVRLGMKMKQILIELTKHGALTTEYSYPVGLHSIKEADDGVTDEEEAGSAQGDSAGEADEG